MSAYFLSSLSSALLILAGLQSSPVAKLPGQSAYDAPSNQQDMPSSTTVDDTKCAPRYLSLREAIDMALESSTAGSQTKDGSPRVTEHTFGVILVQPRLLTFKEGPFRIQIADETVLGYSILKNDPRELSLEGRREGSTVLKLWVGDRHDPAKQTVLSYRVNVLTDQVPRERPERWCKTLEREINAAFCDSYVCLDLVGNRLIVSGEVKDAVEASRILQIIRANLPSIDDIKIINLLRLPGEINQEGR